MEYNKTKVVVEILLLKCSWQEMGVSIGDEKYYIRAFELRFAILKNVSELIFPILRYFCFIKAFLRLNKELQTNKCINDSVKIHISLISISKFNIL